MLIINFKKVSLSEQMLKKKQIKQQRLSIAEAMGLDNVDHRS